MKRRNDLKFKTDDDFVDEFLRLGDEITTLQGEYITSDSITKKRIEENIKECREQDRHLREQYKAFKINELPKDTERNFTKKNKAIAAGTLFVGLTLAVAAYQWYYSGYSTKAREGVTNPKATVEQKVDEINSVRIYTKENKMYAKLALSSDVYEIEKMRIQDGMSVDGLISKYLPKSNSTSMLVSKVNESIYSRREPKAGDSMYIPIRQVTSPEELSKIVDKRNILHTININ